MYIEPNTVVKLLHNIKLNNKYTDTVNFSNTNEQVSYFSSKTKYTIDNNTYQRVNNGSFRCGLSADNCYDCTYMMFQNTNYGNKWFYAFITSVEYVNNDMCIINFEIDDMQTYWFDFTFNQCFIEREHVNDDTFGLHTIEENVPTTDDWQYIQEGFLNLSELSYADVYTKDTITLEDLDVVNGVLCGMPIHKNQTAGAEKDTIQSYVNTGNEDKLIDIFCYPKSNVTGLNMSMAYNLNGYIPKNNKLYSKQFNKCILTNLQGTSVDLFYERTETNNEGIPVMSIGVDKAIIPTPIVQAVPLGYNNYETDYSSSLTVKEFPKVVWSGNIYKQWLANNSVKNMLSLIGFTLTGMMGVASGNPALMGAGVLGQANVFNEYEIQSHKGNKIYGSTDSVNLLIGQNKFGIYLIQLAQPVEYLEIADNYFDMYGYKINRVKNIDYSSRPYWNYVKTKGCTINANLPAGVSEHICNIMDNGVRFWHSGDNIGNYTLNNHN